MNRRASHRYPGVFQVSLYQNNLKLAICQAENVCHDGIFIQLGNTVLQPGIPLEIELEADEIGSRKRARLRAELIHRTDTGAGLHFMEPTTREEILAHALLGYANRRFRVHRDSADTNMVCRTSA
ncbi:MAG: hypothetical protein PVG89_12645 [Gammaproteobacteria bacterium]|jgi:hypothetical protein